MLVFRKIGCALFSCYLRFRVTLLPTVWRFIYQRILNSLPAVRLAKAGRFCGHLIQWAMAVPGQHVFGQLDQSE